MNRYFAYIRVSTIKQGEHGVSLQEQRAAIERHAARQGLSVIEWFEERETAAKGGRPIFTRMLALLRRRKADGLLIHKIDRSARNLKDWAEIGQLLDEGIQVHFCHESLDLHSRGGRLTADIQAVVAADFIRNLREETRKGFYGRLKQGFYPLGAPIGYLDCGGGKVKEPDAVTAPLVRQAFELYATRRFSLETLRNELARRGLRSRVGKEVSVNGLSRILNNPFYTGVIRLTTSQETFSGAHEPLISTTLFEEVQRILKGKAVDTTHKHDFLFRRLFTCRVCGMTLTGERQKGHVYYRCHTGDCETKAVREELLDDQVQATLRKLTRSEEEREDVRQAVKELRRSWADVRQAGSDALKLQAARIEERLTRLTDAYLDRLIDQQVFNERREKLLMEKKQCEQQLVTLETDSSVATDIIEKKFELSQMAHVGYISGDPSEKRSLVEKVTSNRWVEGKNVAVELSFPFNVLAESEKIDVVTLIGADFEPGGYEGPMQDDNADQSPFPQDTRKAA